MIDTDSNKEQLMTRSCLVMTCWVASVALLPSVSIAERQIERVEITVDVDDEVGKIYNFWNVYPVTVQSPFLDPAKQGELRQTYRYARYINCVRFFGGIDLEKDDYFRGIGDNGEAICDFTEGIAALSGIRECGLTPWIVLDNVPAAMCDNPVKNRYGNTQPPSDFRVWSSYVRQFAQALVKNFGRKEVSRWRFRVGTEPDLNPGHWTGTKEQYFAHYDHTVAAVLSVLPDAIIGPGNIIDPVKKRKWESWGVEIIDHCATGTNHATGKIGTPMKFFASSYYTDVGTSDERFDTLIHSLRNRLARYPQLAGVPVEIQEFGILSEGGKWIVGDGTEFGASWFAHFADKIYRLRVPRVYQWWWNTNKGGGIPIPLNHVMDMFEDLVGATRVATHTSRSSEDGHIGCIAAKKDDGIDLIVFCHLAMRDNGQPVPVRVTLRGDAERKKEWSFIRGNVVDGGHAGFMHRRAADMADARAEAGQDADPLAIAISVMSKHREKYERMSELPSLDPLPQLSRDASGTIRFDLDLDGHSVFHLRLQ
jgi:xylan 1,4-beta-xylosidase